MNSSVANLIDWASGWAARPGPGRAISQDSLGLPDGVPEDLLAFKGRLYLVADGVGGHQAGEVASRLAVDVIRRTYYADPDLSAEASLQRAIAEANAEIVRQAQDPARAGMGTTVVAAVTQGEELVVAHVGDSRAYLWRGGQLHQLTADHTWVAERLAAGILTPEEAANHPMRHVLTRSLGNAPEVEADVARYPFMPGDRLLLCTDGVWEVLSAEEMAHILGRADPQGAATALVNRALESGGQDDATALVVERSAPRPRRLAGALSGLPLWAWAFLGLTALLVLGLLCATPVLIGALRRWPTPTARPTPTAQVAWGIMIGGSPSPSSAPTPSPSPSPVPSPSPPPVLLPTETATAAPSVAPSLPCQEYGFQNLHCLNAGKPLYTQPDDRAGRCFLQAHTCVDVLWCETCPPEGWCWCRVRVRSEDLYCRNSQEKALFEADGNWIFGYLPRARLDQCP